MILVVNLLCTIKEIWDADEQKFVLPELLKKQNVFVVVPLDMKSYIVYDPQRAVNSGDCNTSHSHLHGYHKPG